MHNPCNAHGCKPLRAACRQCAERSTICSSNPGPARDSIPAAMRRHACPLAMGFEEKLAAALRQRHMATAFRCLKPSKLNCCAWSRQSKPHAVAVCWRSGSTWAFGISASCMQCWSASLPSGGDGCASKIICACGWLKAFAILLPGTLIELIEGFEFALSARRELPQHAEEALAHLLEGPRTSQTRASMRPL